MKKKKNMSKKMFRKIQNAYEILSDEEKRCLFDRNYYVNEEHFFYDGYFNTNDEDYMRNLLTMNKLKAFRLAQKQLRQAEGGKYDKPEYWASFILLDD